MSKELIKFEDKEFLELVKNSYCRGATDLEFKLFIEQAKTLDLSPVAGQISMIKFWDSGLGREVAQPIVRIDGFRSVAHRTGQFAGRMGPEWCGQDGKWRDIWIDTVPPTAARVGILRKDCKDPIWGTALYSSYCRKKKDGKPMAMWGTMPEVMLAKCAESQALRAAFPLDLGGLYTDDEMGQAIGENERSVVVETDLLALPKSETWEPTKAACLQMQQDLVAVGIEFTPANKQFFTALKERLTGKPVQSYKEIVDLYVEEIMGATGGQ